MLQHWCNGTLRATQRTFSSCSDRRLALRRLLREVSPERARCRVSPPVLHRSTPPSLRCPRQTTFPFSERLSLCVPLRAMAIFPTTHVSFSNGFELLVQFHKHADFASLGSGMRSTRRSANCHTRLIPDWQCWAQPDFIVVVKLMTMSDFMRQRRRGSLPFLVLFEPKFQRPMAMCLLASNRGSRMTFLQFCSTILIRRTWWMSQPVCSASPCVCFTRCTSCCGRRHNSSACRQAGSQLTTCFFVHPVTVSSNASRHFFAAVSFNRGAGAFCLRPTRKARQRGPSCASAEWPMPVVAGARMIHGPWACCKCSGVANKRSIRK
mmetsp:Transcript_7702/g.24044  ORF Transcript_7702/g.24044 Transcript_7702/m.24044 type:complete len:322 (+) Transcript_7702:143-1108(+)